MASTNKTPYLRLNAWITADKPKMTDFNMDNAILDDFAQSHAGNNDIHITPDQSAWLNQPYATGTYTGTGAATREVPLGFQPKLLFVFAQNYGPIELDTEQNIPQLRFAAAADGYGSAGVAVTATGFTVSQMQQNPLPGMSKTCLNQSNVTYRYFAMR